MTPFTTMRKLFNFYQLKRQLPNKVGYHFVSYSSDIEGVKAHFERAKEWHKADENDCTMSNVGQRWEPVHNTREKRLVTFYTISVTSELGRWVCSYLGGNICRARL
jgi:hypothetical protein